MRPQWADNILCEVWLVRIPDKANGNYRWGVHEDPSDPNPLATVALEKKDKEKLHYPKATSNHHVDSHTGQSVQS